MREARGRGANGSGTIMPVHDRTVLGHLIQFRSFELNPFALLLKKNADIAVAQVVCQYEYNVRMDYLSA